MADRNDILLNIDADVNHFNELYPQLETNSQSEYHDISKLNSLDYLPNRDLSVIHLNCRSLNANYDEILALFDLVKIKFDVICFTES